MDEAKFLNDSGVKRPKRCIKAADGVTCGRMTEFRTFPRRCTIMCRLCLLTLALIICGMGSEPKSLLAQNWPRFRGENGSGLSDLPGIPSAWTDDEYAWKIELPQVGHSSPIVWGKTLFITSATEGGGERFVHCLDADSGQERWQRSIQLNRSEKHQKNSWASSTPATDGRHVYVLFADDARQLVIAWDFSGNEVWRRDAGTY